jgi:PhoPQ-activated pathogenicity-related protein
VGHGLHGSYLPANLVSFYQHIISGNAIPEFRWNISKDSIYVGVTPGWDYQIRLWEAVNENGRDFKIYVLGEEAWKMKALELTEDGAYAIPVSAPETGYKAALVELIFNPGSQFPLTFTTGTLINPDQYPFDPFQPDLSDK